MPGQMRNHAKVLVVWDLALVLLVIDTVKYCQGSKFEGRPLFSASSILSLVANIIVLTKLESVCSGGKVKKLKEPIFSSFQQTKLNHH